MQMKASFEDNYLDHMSNLKIESNPSKNTLTTIACGISTYILLWINIKYLQFRIRKYFFKYNHFSI